MSVSGCRYGGRDDEKNRNRGIKTAVSVGRCLKTDGTVARTNPLRQEGVKTLFKEITPVTDNCGRGDLEYFALVTLAFISGGNRSEGARPRNPNVRGGCSPGIGGRAP